MHRALWKLMKLRWRAAWRRWLRQVKTIRGALMLLVWLGMMSPLCCGLLGPLVLPDAAMPNDAMATGRQTVRDLAPLGIFLVWLLALGMSGGDKALVFT